MNSTRQICTWIIAKRWPYFTSAAHTHTHTMGRNPQSAQIHTAGYTNQAETAQALSNKKTCLPCKEYPSQLRWWMYALVAWFDSIFRGSNWRSAPDSQSQAANGKPMVLFRFPFSIKLKGGPWVCTVFFLKAKTAKKASLSWSGLLVHEVYFCGKTGWPPSLSHDLLFQVSASFGGAWSEFLHVGLS